LSDSYSNSFQRFLSIGVRIMMTVEISERVVLIGWYRIHRRWSPLGWFTVLLM
jgi:hypothetical protein